MAAKSKDKDRKEKGKVKTKKLKLQKTAKELTEGELDKIQGGWHIPVMPR
jgi:hypothetical protein